MAERAGDITDEVYRSLFARHPEFEPMFVLDTGGAARGNMLAKAFDALLDLVGERRFGRAFIQAECTNHEGIGVSRDAFAAFFAIVMETVATAMAEEWTPEFELAWRGLLDDANAALAEAG